MSHRMVRPWFALALIPVLTAVGCDWNSIFGAGVPASQQWTISEQEGNMAAPLANVIVVKGGAISQGNSFWRQFNGNCGFSLPMRGNWNSQIVRITSTGSNCNVGFILTLEGTVNGNYGAGDKMTGTYRVTYSGAWSGGDSGTWIGFPSR